jgi:spermidine/putrescine transport system permease protein
MNSSRIPILTTGAVLAFFYLPIGALVVKSFNSARYSPEWKGFTFQWYERLFQRDDILLALLNSLKVASIAAVVSMLLGTCAAFALHRYKSSIQEAHRMMIQVPLVLPDILMGMSLLLLFIAVGVSLSLVTITVAHITFCLSYVTLVVLARLQDFDPSLVEAARDLGASRLQAFVKVTFPVIFPGILAGGLLAFTLSIDDYVITFFVKGPGSDTLPTLVYSMIKKSKELPVINALSTLMLLFTFLLVFASQRLVRPVKA